jgi:cytidylate kinase
MAMNTSLPLERYTEALGRATSHWTERDEAGTGARASPPRPITITISREAGAGGSPIARLVATRLGWPVYDYELVQRIAGEMGLRTRLLESVDERQASWVQETLEAFTSGPSVSQSRYVEHLAQTLLALAAHGRCVIVGRGAAHLLPAESTLRVRLVAPRAERVASIGQRLGLSPAEAAERVTKIDRERTRFVKDHFHKDPTDTGWYDLVINTARFPGEKCADLIVEALYRLETPARRDVSPPP